MRAAVAVNRASYRLSSSSARARRPRERGLDPLRRPEISGEESGPERELGAGAGKHVLGQGLAVGQNPLERGRGGLGEVRHQHAVLERRGGGGDAVDEGGDQPVGLGQRLLREHERRIADHRERGLKIGRRLAQSPHQGARSLRKRSIFPAEKSLDAAAHRPQGATGIAGPHAQAVLLEAPQPNVVEHERDVEAVVAIGERVGRREEPLFEIAPGEARALAAGESRGPQSGVALVQPELRGANGIEPHQKPDELVLQRAELGAGGRGGGRSGQGLGGGDSLDREHQQGGQNVEQNSSIDRTAHRLASDFPFALICRARFSHEAGRAPTFNWLFRRRSC